MDTDAVDHGPAAGPATAEQALVDLTVEGWRFARLFGRVLAKLDVAETARYASQLRFFTKKLQDSLAAAGLRLVDVEGTPFDAGLAATAVNIADFEPDDQLVVDHMLEPIIMGPDGLRRQGCVMLRKVKP